MLTYSDKADTCSIECKSTNTYNNPQHPFKLDKTDNDIKKATPYVYNEGDFTEGNGFILQNAYKDLGKVDLRRLHVVKEQMCYERRHTLCYFYKEGNERKGTKCNNDKPRQGKVTELDVVVERNEDVERKRKGIVMESKYVQTGLIKRDGKGSEMKEGIFRKKKIGKIKCNNDGKDCAGKGKERCWRGGNVYEGEGESENVSGGKYKRNENAYKVNDDNNNECDGENVSGGGDDNEEEDLIGSLYKQIRKSKHKKKINLNYNNIIDKYNNNNINKDINNHDDNSNHNNNKTINKPKPKKNLNILTQSTNNNNLPTPIPKSFLNRQPFQPTSPSPLPNLKTPPYRSLLEHFNQNRSYHPPFPPQPSQLLITSYSSKPTNPPHPLKKNNFDNIKLLSQTEHLPKPLPSEASSSSSRRCYFLDDAEINGIKAPIDVSDLKSKFHTSNNNNITRNKTNLADITKQLVIDKTTFHNNISTNCISTLLTPKKVTTPSTYASQPSKRKYNWYIVDSIIYPINNMHETALRIDNKHLYK